MQSNEQHIVRAMKGTGYKILGYLVWREGTWYLRRRLPSLPTMIVGAVATAATTVGGVLILRRVAGGRSREVT